MWSLCPIPHAKKVAMLQSKYRLNYLPLQGIIAGMNYIKTFDELEIDIENVVNVWLKDINSLGHRVMNSKAHYIGGTVKMIFTINDEPHPHKTKTVGSSDSGSDM